MLSDSGSAGWIVMSAMLVHLIVWSTAAGKLHVP